MIECERALDIHRAVGNRHQEGVALGTLGGLLAKLGRIDEARARLRAGDGLLRELGDRIGRASLLCEWAGAEAAAGAVPAAIDVLAEAAHALDEAGIGLDCEAGRRLSSLRDRLRPAAGVAMP